MFITQQLPLAAQSKPCRQDWRKPWKGLAEWTPSKNGNKLIPPHPGCAIASPCLHTSCLHLLSTSPYQHLHPSSLGPPCFHDSFPSVVSPCLRHSVFLSLRLPAFGLSCPHVSGHSVFPCLHVSHHSASLCVHVRCYSISPFHHVSRRSICLRVLDLT